MSNFEAGPPVRPVRVSRGFIRALKNVGARDEFVRAVERSAAKPEPWASWDWLTSWRTAKRLAVSCVVVFGLALLGLAAL